jgi:hypothetical protein
MQNVPVYLYQNNLDVILDLDPAILGVNQVMYQRNLTIQKGIKNQVRFQFKNSDQKRINIHNTQTFVFSMFDAINQRLLLEKELEVLEVNTATKGLAQLTLTENDTVNLEKSSYKFSVKLRDTDGTYLPTYANTYYGITGVINLAADTYPVLQPSQEIKTFQKSFNPGTLLYEHKSRAIYANPEYNGNNALHTAAFYLTGYRGTVYIQATLNNSAADLNKYSTIATRTYNGFSGIDYINFNGIYSYIQIMHVPATAPAEGNNDNPAYFGSFDKILYRS